MEMIIKDVTKEDLPMLAKLVGNDDWCDDERISFEHSKMCVDEKGDIQAFIILRHNSLIDYFGGEIPLDIKIMNSPHYYEGAEYAIIEYVKDYCTSNNQYEIIIYYNKAEPTCLYAIEPLSRTYMASSDVVWKDMDGVIWMKYEPRKDNLLRTRMYNFNDKVWLDFLVD